MVGCKSFRNWVARVWLDSGRDGRRAINSGDGCRSPLRTRHAGTAAGTDDPCATHDKTNKDTGTAAECHTETEIDIEISCVD